MTIFLLCPYMTEGVRKLSRGSFIRDLIPLEKASPSSLNHLPKALPPRTVILGIRVTTYKLGNTNIQSITNATHFFCFLSLLSFFLFSSVFSAVQHYFDNFLSNHAGFNLLAKSRTVWLLCNNSGLYESMVLLYFPI